MAANEEVVAELISKLTADVADYMKGMKSSVDEANKTAKSMEEHAKSVDGFTKKLTQYAHAAMSALASLGAMDFLKESFGKFQEAESGALKLTAALEANDRQVESLLADYNEFAASIQELTVLDDDAVLSLLRVAETFDLTGDSAKSAVKNAIALAAVNGGSAESMIRMTAAMEQGNLEQAMAFARMIPQLRGVKDQTEFIEKYNKLISSGFKASAAEATSSSGKIKQLTNAYDNLKEEVGGVVAEAVNPLVASLKEAVKWFTELDPNIKRFVVLTAIATASVIVLWTAINAGMLVFDVLSGGVLLLIGAIVTGIAALAVWSSQFNDLGEAIGVAKKYLQALVDNWELVLLAMSGPIFLPVIGSIILITKLVQHLWPVLVELWSEVSNEATKAWKEVEQGVAEFMDFVEPVLSEIKRLGQELWDDIKNNAGNALRDMVAGLKLAWKWAKEAWAWIGNLADRFGQLEVAGIKILDWVVKFRDTVKFAVTLLRLLADSWEDVFTLVAVIVALKMMNIYEDIKYAFVVAGPAVLKYFGEQVKSVFNQVGRYVASLFLNLLSRLAQSIEELPEILKDKNRLGEIWKGLFPEGGLKIEVAPFDKNLIPQRALNQLEQELTTVMERLQTKLTLRILGLMMKPEPEEEHWWNRLMKGLGEKAALVGDNLGNGIKAAEKELEKFDAALFRSTEAATRIEHYRESLRGYGNALAPAAIPPIPGPNDVMMFENRQQPVPVELRGADDRNGQEQVSLLKNIRDLAQDEAAKPIMRIELLNLQG